MEAPVVRALSKEVGPSTKLVAVLTCALLQSLVIQLLATRLLIGCTVTMAEDAGLTGRH